MAAHRRTASDVKVELNQTDDEDGNAGGASDETDDIDLIDEDEDEFLNHPLVPNDSYRGNFTQFREKYYKSPRLHDRFNSVQI